MSDSLYSDIEERLSKPLDHDVFEQCSFSLLRVPYPTLAPVRGGHDVGMDGYAGAVDALPIVLVATTGSDAIGNLRRNLQSHLKGDGKARRAIFATSQSLSGQKRRNLENAAEQLSFDLIQIFDRFWFVDQLYRDSMWRKELLGLTGAAPALSMIPVSRRPHIALPLVGRQHELDTLRATAGDIVLVGKSGIGKTAVLRELVAEGWGLFLADDSDERIPDAVREQRPSRIIVDDAHFVRGRLPKLRQLRGEIDGDFWIVAVTWPGAKEAVSADLGFSARHVDIGPLSREDIVEVIKRAGLKGPVDFVREIVDQAMGRPGLAAILALMSLNGEAQKVATGEALLQDTRVTYEGVLGGQSGAILAIIALSGNAGIDIGTVQTALHLDLACTQLLLHGLASDGTIDEARTGGARLIVQPESLRYAVVREMFFGGVASLPLESVLQAFDDPAIAVVPLVGAAHRGAPVDRSVMRPLVQRSHDPRAFAEYASLGEEEASFALSAAPQHALDIARAALPRSPDLAFRVLMTKAIGDDRPRHSHPDHPMRMIADFLAHPSGRLEHRRWLVEIASEWAREDKNPDVALEALCCVLKPGFETTTTDPGRGYTVTMQAGVLPVRILRQITEFWDQTLDIIPTMHCQSYDMILGTLEDWVFPTRLLLQPTEAKGEPFEFMRDQARAAMIKLANSLPHHRGVLARLSRLSTRAQLGVKVRTDREFDVLFPEDGPVKDPSDWKAVQQRQIRAAEKLARSMSLMSAEEAVARLVAAEREAAEAGINSPRMTAQVSKYLANKASTPMEYVRALENGSAAADLMAPFLLSLVRFRPRGWSQIVRQLLAHEVYWWAAIPVCLTESVGSSLQREAIRRCDGRLSNYLKFIAVRDEIDADAVDGLLDHPDPEVARAVAIPLEGRIDNLPRRTREKWEAAIVRCPADDYQYAQILARRGGLLERWVGGWLERQASDKLTFERVPDSLLSAIRNLPDKSRRHLLERVPRGIQNPYANDLLAALVGENEELLPPLFARAELRHYRGAVLRGKPTPSWLRRAKVALELGYSEEQVIAACTGGMITWGGPEAAYWDSWVEEFRKLGDLDDPIAKRLSEVGLRHYGSRRDAAAAREREEEIYGD